MKWFLIWVVASILVGCGNNKGAKDHSNQPPPGPGIFGLIGVAGSTYSSQCAVDEDQESQLELVVVAERSFEFRYYNHDGVDCNPEQRLQTYTYRNIKVEEETRPEVPGVRTFVYEVGVSTAVVHTNFLARKFSQREVFGYNDWSVDVEKEINDRKFDADSEPKTRKGAIRMRSIIFDGDVLKLARYKDGKLIPGEFNEFRKL
jgi:hypothetical protein